MRDVVARCPIPPGSCSWAARIVLASREGALGGPDPAGDAAPWGLDVAKIISP